MRRSASVIVLVMLGVVDARGDGFLWLSAENSSPTSIYRYNLATHAIDLVTEPRDPDTGLPLSNDGVYNNLAVDGTFLYIGTDDSDILALAHPLTGVVQEVLFYDPPFNQGDQFEDGAYDSRSGTLWRSVIAGELLQNTTDGVVLAVRDVVPAPPFHLLGMEWVDGALYASTLHEPTFGVLDDPFGAPSYRPLGLTGIPSHHKFDGLAFDPETRLMYLATRTTDRAFLWKFDLATLTATQEADLVQVGYPAGAFCDAIGWYNPKYAGYDPFLSVEATCPEGGAVVVTWTGATPNGTVGLVYAASTGALVIPPIYPCAGTQLGLSSQSIQIVFQGSGGPNGTRTVTGSAPAAACGGFLQLVDGATCKTSGIAILH